MEMEIYEKFGHITFKAECDDVPFQDANAVVPKTTIITEEEFFNIHGYIFDSDLKIEGAKLQVQDYAPRIEAETDEQFRGSGSDNAHEIVCAKKAVVKLTRLSNREMSNILCRKRIVLKVKKLSPETMKQYSTESSSKISTPINSSQISYTCAVCRKGFKSKIGLKSHQRIHGTAQHKCLCNICSKTFSHSGALKQHLQEHMGEKGVNSAKKWDCPFCEMKFFTSQELMVHRRTHTDLELHQCKLCPMNFTTIAHLKSHERDHKRHSTMEKPFQCYLCGQKFVLLHFLKNHMRIHTTSYDCRICMKIFDQEVDLDMHMLTHSGKYRFECSQCGKGFNYRTSFVRHERIHTGQKPFECEHCHKTFREKDYLLAHRRTHTADKTIDHSNFTWRYSNERKSRQSKTNCRSGTTSKRVKKVFKCKICLKLLKSENELNSHFEGHNGKFLFECQECSKGFNYRPNLYRHMKQHTGVKPHKCHLCPRTYGDIGSLRVHIRWHNGEKFECDICLGKFSDKGYLKIHKRMHTGEKPFECPQCKTKFKVKQSLTLHTCFECGICLRYFPTKLMIRRHMNEHLKQGQTSFHYTKLSKRGIGKA